MKPSFDARTRRRPLWAVGCWAALAHVLFGACTSQSSSTDGNTSWLGRCEEQSECRTGLDCLCGVCTRSCGTTADCVTLGAEAVCTPASDDCSGTTNTCALASGQPDGGGAGLDASGEPVDAPAIDAPAMQPLDASSAVRDADAVAAVGGTVDTSCEAPFPDGPLAPPATSLPAVEACAPAAWSTPVMLYGVTSSSTIDADLAATNADTFLMAARLESQVWGASFDPGPTTWAGPGPVASTTQGYAHAKLLSTRDGQADVFWRETSDRYELWTAPFTEPPSPQLGAPLVLNVHEYDVAPLPDGGAVLAWMDGVGSEVVSDTRLFIARRGTDRESWTGPKGVSVDEPYGASLAVDGAGRIAVAFETHAGTYPRIAVRRYNADLSACTETEEITPTMGGYPPVIAADHRGNLLLAWDAAETSPYIAAARFHASWGSWEAPRMLAEFSPSYVQTPPSLAMSPGGHAVLAFTIYTEVADDTGAIYYDADTDTWGPLIMLGGGTGSVAAGIDANGNAYIAWADTLSVSAKRYDRASASWEATAPLHTGDSVYEPALAVTPRGETLLVWSEFPQVPYVGQLWWSFARCSAP